MLTKYKNPPKPVSGKKPKTKSRKTDTPTPPPEDGTRKEGTDFFNSISVKAQILPSTVELRTDESRASGVILGTAAGKAYVLTAKHVLWTLRAHDGPQDPPSGYDISKYGTRGIRIRYELADLKREPSKEALVTAINFAGVTNSDTTWTYDAVLMECENEAFVNFVKANRFIKPREIWRYTKTLPEKDEAYALLSKRDYKFMQLGFGKPKDPDLTGLADNYEDCEGKLQCKVSIPVADTPAPGELVEPDSHKERTEWQSFSNAIELRADNTCSTAGGDSGGPLFSVSNDLSEFYLVGVTTGANYYADDTLRKETQINNNVATYWEPMFNYCQETFLTVE